MQIIRVQIFPHCHISIDRGKDVLKFPRHNARTIWVDDLSLALLYCSAMCLVYVCMLDGVHKHLGTLTLCQNQWSRGILIFSLYKSKLICCYPPLWGSSGSPWWWPCSGCRWWPRCWWPRRARSRRGPGARGTWPGPWSGTSCPACARSRSGTVAEKIFR